MPGDSARATPDKAFRGSERLRERSQPDGTGSTLLRRPTPGLSFPEKSSLLSQRQLLPMALAPTLSPEAPGVFLCRATPAWRPPPSAVKTQARDSPVLRLCGLPSALSLPYLPPPQWLIQGGWGEGERGGKREGKKEEAVFSFHSVSCLCDLPWWYRNVLRQTCHWCLSRPH